MIEFKVWRTVVDVFDYCWRERRAMLRFGWLPVVVTIIGGAIGQAFGLEKAEPSIGLTLLGLLQAVVLLPVSVTWYRMVALGDAEAQRRPVFTLGRLEWRLFWWQLFIIVGLGVVGVVGSFIIVGLHTGLSTLGYLTAALGAAIGLGAILLAALLFAALRLAMVLVLVAVDKPIDLAAAWRMTDGLGWRLVAALILTVLGGGVVVLAFQLVGLVLGMIAAMAANSTAGKIVPYINLVGENVSGLVIFLAGATVFGIVYRQLAAATAAENTDG